MTKHKNRQDILHLFEATEILEITGQCSDCAVSRPTAVLFVCDSGFVCEICDSSD